MRLRDTSFAIGIGSTAPSSHADCAPWVSGTILLSLLTDIRDQTFAAAELRTRRDDLQSQLHKIYRAAPHTDGKAYVQAQNALKNNEDLTFSDPEIDAFLPGPLKRKNSP